MSDVFTDMRSGLRSKGTEPIVRLGLRSNACFFNEDFVQAAVDELEKKTLMAITGLYEMTDCDKLVFQLLKDSAEL